MAAVYILETLDQLRDYLDTLNATGQADQAAVVGASDVLRFVYCTDPDGAWYALTGNYENAWHAVADRGQGENPVAYAYGEGLASVFVTGPFTILHEGLALQFDQLHEYGSRYDWAM